MRIFHLISFRLFVLITIILSILTFWVSYFQLQSQEVNYEKMIMEFGNRVSSLVLSSTKLTMLENNKEDTHYLINTIADLDGIEKIRIYNKTGIIIFSTVPSEINNSVDMENEACFMCHKSSEKIIHEPLTTDRKRTFFAQDGTRLLGFVTAIKNEESCYTAECHAHDKKDPLLGTLDVIMSLDKTDKILEEEKADMVSGNAIITLILSFSIGIFIWIFVHTPVKKILNGTIEISRGNLDYEIKSTSNDEIGKLAKSFNQMTLDLKVAKKEIITWSDELEKRVKEKTNELKKTQEGVLQIEKMASIGKLSATVAHELNNPLAGILTYSKLIQKKLLKETKSQKELDDIIKYLKMIESESDRCGSIIKNLLLFSKKHDLEIKKCRLNTVVEQSVQLIKHHLHLNSIDLEMDLNTEIPFMFADENQLKQALLGIFLNAIEAMDKDGKLSVVIERDENNKYAIIKITDTGRGIPKDIENKIFEPFFTTKDKIKGVGLGLSTAYGIIKKHNGDITLISELNVGSTFTIKLPYNKKLEEHE